MSKDVLNRKKIYDLSTDLYIDAKVEALAHTYAADYWGGSHLALGLTITALSAAVSASIFSTYAFLGIIGGGLSLLLVVISAVSTFLNPDQRTTSHQKSKVLYTGIAERAKALYEVDLELREQKPDDLCETYEKLLKEMDETRKNSPRVPMRHFKRIEKEGKLEAIRKEARKSSISE